MRMQWPGAPGQSHVALRARHAASFAASVHAVRYTAGCPGLSWHCVDADAAESVAPSLDLDVVSGLGAARAGAASAAKRTERTMAQVHLPRL